VCAFEVGKILGPGSLESVYEKALCLKLAKRGLQPSIILLICVHLRQKRKSALVRLVWVVGHSDLAQVVMGSPDLTTNGEVGRGVSLPATR